jgi:flagellar biosynthesis/type III secretory pathway M-ring protein FliF/YscJ
VSGWEIFTWANVGILSVGSLVVFALFLRQVRTLLGDRPSEGAEAVQEAAAPDEQDEEQHPAPRSPPTGGG